MKTSLGHLLFLVFTSVTALAVPGRSTYVTSNSPAGNAVLHYRLSPNGQLTETGSYPTGGMGTGAGLGSQSGLFLASDGDIMLAVNAGSHEVSALIAVGPSGQFAKKSKAPSGGMTPISVTAFGPWVYVVNAGDATHQANVSGFYLVRYGVHRGTLIPVPSSSRLLSQPAAAPAEVAFGRDGRVLVVTEKATNSITTFTLDYRTGLLSQANVQKSVGQTPFGFVFNRHGDLIVTEAFGGAASALSSYEVSYQGDIAPISESVPAPDQKAACWVTLTRGGRYAFVTNAATNSVSTYSQSAGALTLVAAAAATTSGNGPIDVSVSPDNKYLIVLQSSGVIDTFAVNGNSGALTKAATLTGLPHGAYGLVTK